MTRPDHDPAPGSGPIPDRDARSDRGPKMPSEADAAGLASRPILVTRTDLLEAEPLPPLKSPRERMLRALVIVVVFGVLGFLGGRDTWWLIFAGVVVWGIYCASVWWDARAFVQAKGRTLAVRNHLRMHEIDAADVAGVRYQFNGRRPDFTVQTRQGKSIWVPCSRLERGHSTLFAWVGWFAPTAELDQKSQRYFDHLVAEKLI
ncbi:hypothetical protein [Aestuariimicrobium sp. T2.26MG-19.2B]|uniref:hypothetical protein n=1 Tax=Aestuariimicrobium sp. T2.26MG-19.2B TaxID=3040679 RepID=UPI0024778910|nr:hypothetical protein [Aestuariimicrobium sp. T2.26MG-19.2B]CAI9403839.1 hypothetical protein AESSP_01085 [Aestuariimicrobium sp. T2.26MG-19.2B]